MCTTLLALVILFLPAAAPVSGGDEFRDAATGIEFPANLGSLDRVKLTRYEPAELGLSVRYTGPNLLKADIYIYTAGLADLGTGEKGVIVQEHFAEVKGVVFMMEKKGTYKDVKLDDEREISWDTAAGPLPMLHAVLQYSEVVAGSVRSGDARVSHIYLAEELQRVIQPKHSTPVTATRRQSAAWGAPRGASP